MIVNLGIAIIKVIIINLGIAIIIMLGVAKIPRNIHNFHKSSNTLAFPFQIMV